MAPAGRLTILCPDEISEILLIRSSAKDGAAREPAHHFLQSSFVDLKEESLWCQDLLLSA